MKNALKIFITIFVIFISINVSALEIKYEGANKGIIKDGDTLFNDINLVYPGDSATDEVIIKNTTNVPLEVYFKVNSGESRLADALLLTVVLDYNGAESTIYNGDFVASPLNNYISLGTYKAGFNGKLKFILSVPSTLDNDFAADDLDTVFTFMVEDKGYNSDKNVIDPITDTNGDGKINGKDKDKSKSIISPTTFDDIAKYFGLLILSIIGIAIYFVSIKRKKIEGE